MFKLFLKVWLNPRFWIFSGLYSRKSYKIFNMLLKASDRLQLENSGPFSCTLRLDDYLFTVWIANYPYSYLQEVEVRKIDYDVPYDAKKLWKCSTSILQLKDVHPGRNVVYQIHEMLREKFHIGVDDRKPNKDQQNQLIEQIIRQIETKAVAK